MTWQQASRVGLIAASQALRRWKVDPHKWVDVFDVAANLGVGLNFQPTGKLSAALLTLPDSAQGILVNSNHPLTRQRYSVAHELGHLFFKHQTTIDTDDIFLGGRMKTRSKEEQYAESFASWFLMPPDLLDSYVKSNGIDRLQTAEQAYQMSLALGTSYEATITHLRYTDRVTPERSKVWLKETPAKLKRKLAGEYVPENAWNDVHLLSERHSGGSRLVRSGDRIILEFSEIPSTGYRWSAMPTLEGVSIVHEGFADVVEAAQSDGRKTGIDRKKRIILAVDSVERRQDFVIGFESVRSWQPGQAAAHFKLALAVEPQAQRGVPQRYFEVAA